MRWVFAGLFFAGLIGLAVTTVAVRVANVAVRARLEAIAQRVVVQSIENGRRRCGVRVSASPVALARRWRELERAAVPE